MVGLEGFDMKETIRWYEKNGIQILSIEKKPLRFPIENSEYIELSPEELGGLLELLPENAKERSIIRKIKGQPITYFSKNSTPERPQTTTDVSEALSSTAIVPSYIDYTPWREMGKPTGDIWLYQLPENIPESVRKVILTEGFIHELAHSVIQPALYIDQNIQFSNGEIINGLESILGFTKMAEIYPPISHYASSYRGKDNKFESDDPNYNINTAISEELAETIAAYYMGFAFCKDDVRGRDPFRDRPNIKQWVENFLNAKLLK